MWFSSLKNRNEDYQQQNNNIHMLQFGRGLFFLLTEFQFL